MGYKTFAGNLEKLHVINLVSNGTIISDFQMPLSGLQPPDPGMQDEQVRRQVLETLL